MSGPSGLKFHLFLGSQGQISMRYTHNIERLLKLQKCKTNKKGAVNGASNQSYG